MKYRHNDLHGLLVVDKPVGVTSMDVVRVVRRAAGHCKTGHCGTLDPLASGVLVVCFGRGTKAVDHVMGQTKVYEATVDLSALSATDDAEGPIEPVEVAAVPTIEQVRAALDGLIGEIQQTPPAHSAIKIGGKRAYDLARAGQSVQMPPRTVRIDAIDLVEYAYPILKVRVVCGKGTYIRSLARQIGSALGTGGYLTSLRRTAIGSYSADQAVKLDELPQPLTQAALLPVPKLR